MSSAEKPYEGFATFLKSPIGDLSRPIGVFGIPYDGSNSFRPGARLAPTAIRQASMMLTDGCHPLFGVDPSLHVTDLGDISISNIDVQQSLTAIVTAIENHPMFMLDTARLMFMGGDHTVTLGILEAFTKRYSDLMILHFDAHGDHWPSHFDSPIGHGTWVRNIIEWGWVKPENIIQIGVRSPVDPITRDWLRDKGGTVWSARQAEDSFNFNVLHQVQKMLQDGLLKGKKVYISLDIDSLDPAYAPGTGTPEIAGLRPHTILEILETIECDIIGMDVVEVSPPYDQSEITALAAATFLWTIASQWCRKIT